MGRALGDGVYSAIDPAIAMGYAGASGSLLHMTGVVSNEVVQSGNVRVFKNPKDVLPMYYILVLTINPLLYHTTFQKVGALNSKTG